MTVLGRSLIISRTSSLPAATADSVPRNCNMNNCGKDINVNISSQIKFNCMIDHVLPYTLVMLMISMKEYVKRCILQRMLSTSLKKFTSIVPVLLLISIFAPESVRILLIRIPTNNGIEN